MSLKQHIIEVLERAAKTFVEAFLATLAVTNVSSGKSALVGAIGAGVSAVWTTAVKLEAGTNVGQYIEDDLDDILSIHDEEDDEDEDEQLKVGITPTVVTPISAASTTSVQPPTQQVP